MNIQAIIFNYRHPPSNHLIAWLESHGVPWWEGSQEFGIDCARNQGVNRFLSECDADYLLMLDNDMLPGVVTAPILTQPGDILYCGYRDRGGGIGHWETFGAGCCRLSRTMLAAMPRPYFLMGYNIHRDRRIYCECSYFAASATRAGYTPQRVGTCGHDL